MNKTTLGIVMDPIDSITPEKDTGFALCLAAQARGWDVYYIEPQHLFFADNQAQAMMRPLTVVDRSYDWFSLGEIITQPLSALNIILMRQDPPFNMNYIYTTYLLEHAEREGTLVINKPSSLRDCNEKLFTTWFPQCVAPQIITSQQSLLHAFIEQEKKIIIKPLDNMGGTGIALVQVDDADIDTPLRVLTNHFTTPIVAQRYIPEVIDGDKRILLINGKPIPYALARIPQPGEIRANLAAGGRGEPRALTQQDYWLCEQVSEILVSKGLRFVGLDVIGDYITEINVTSPTCVRQLDALCGLSIAEQFLEAIAVEFNF